MKYQQGSHYFFLLYNFKLFYSESQDESQGTLFGKTQQKG